MEPNSILILLVLSVAIGAEWIEIPQQNSEITRQHDLALDHSTILRNIYSKKDLNNLKYEDLKDMIGSGFENEFGKFLEDHHRIDTNNFDILAFDGSEFESVGNETIMNESAFSVDKLSAPGLTTTKPNQDKSQQNTKPTGNNQGKHANETINFKLEKHKLVDNVRRLDANQMDGIVPTKNIDDKLFMADEQDERPKNINKTKSEVNGLNQTTKKKKKIVFRLLKVQPSNPLTFSGILEFLKGIQKSFITDAAGGIKNKIKSLENFKDQLMDNISIKFNLLANKIKFQSNVIIIFRVSLRRAMAIKSRTLQTWYFR